MSVVEFVRSHGYLLLFVAVLADQSGLPLPAAPFLIAAGALMQNGTLNPFALVLTAVCASLLGHTAWYYAGRHKGISVLRRVCQLSLEPDACMRRTQDIFSRLGPYSLIAVRFIPGIDTMAQPLAGMTGMTPLRYLTLSLAGAVLWVSVFLGIGYTFGDQLDTMLQPLLRLGARVLPVLVGGALALYLLYKLVQRYRVLLDVKMERMTVDELKSRMDAGQAPVVVDLRTTLEARLFPRTIPGAIRLGRRKMDEQLAKIDADREIVLFCNCPHEIYAARTALSLIRQGRTRVRPLQGGLGAWQQRKYPVEKVRLE